MLFYGSGRLVNQGPNIRTSFDAGVVSWELAPWRVDAFYAVPVDPRFGYFDDRPSGSRRIWSVYLTRAFPKIGTGSGLDVYYFGFDNDAAKFNQGAGDERRPRWTGQIRPTMDGSKPANGRPGTVRF